MAAIQLLPITIPSVFSSHPYTRETFKLINQHVAELNRQLEHAQKKDLILGHQIKKNRLDDQQQQLTALYSPFVYLSYHELLNIVTKHLLPIKELIEVQHLTGEHLEVLEELSTQTQQWLEQALNDLHSRSQLYKVKKANPKRDLHHLLSPTMNEQDVPSEGAVSDDDRILAHQLLDEFRYENIDFVIEPVSVHQQDDDSHPLESRLNRQKSALEGYLTDHPLRVKPASKNSSAWSRFVKSMNTGFERLGDWTSYHILGRTSQFVLLGIMSLSSAFILSSALSVTLGPWVHASTLSLISATVFTSLGLTPFWLELSKGFSKIKQAITHQRSAYLSPLIGIQHRLKNHQYEIGKMLRGVHDLDGLTGSDWLDDIHAMKHQIVDDLALVEAMRRERSNETIDKAHEQLRLQHDLLKRAIGWLNHQFRHEITGQMLSYHEIKRKSMACTLERLNQLTPFIRHEVWGPDQPPIHWAQVMAHHLNAGTFMLETQQGTRIDTVALRVAEKLALRLNQDEQHTPTIKALFDLLRAKKSPSNEFSEYVEIVPANLRPHFSGALRHQLINTLTQLPIERVHLLDDAQKKALTVWHQHHQEEIESLESQIKAAFTKNHTPAFTNAQHQCLTKLVRYHALTETPSCLDQLADSKRYEGNNECLLNLLDYANIDKTKKAKEWLLKRFHHLITHEQSLSLSDISLMHSSHFQYKPDIITSIIRDLENDQTHDVQKLKEQLSDHGLIQKSTRVRGSH